MTDKQEGRKGRKALPLLRRASCVDYSKRESLYLLRSQYYYSSPLCWGFPDRSIRSRVSAGNPQTTIKQKKEKGDTRMRSSNQNESRMKQITSADQYPSKYNRIQICIHIEDIIHTDFSSSLPFLRSCTVLFFILRSPTTTTRSAFEVVNRSGRFSALMNSIKIR